MHTQEALIVDSVQVFGLADPISSLTHLGGAAAFATLGVFLVQRARGNGLRVVSVCIYVAGVVFALAASGVFHLVDHDTATRSVLQRVDHAGIFFLIAATYTPVHIIEFKGVMRWGVLAVVWSAAVSLRDGLRSSVAAGKLPAPIFAATVLESGLPFTMAPFRVPPPSTSRTPWSACRAARPRAC